MNGRAMMLLGMAVAFGLGAMFLTHQFINTDPKQEEEQQDVLVAARDFKDEESLKPDMVKVVRMAKSAVPPFSFSSFKDVEDRWVSMSMLEGDVLIEKKLGPKGSPPGLVNNIPTGMRALSIDVTEQTGVSGFILPGHRVDVIRFVNSEHNQTHGEAILEDVLVLAAGQVFIRPEERAVQSRTVTLAVTPADVGILVEARAKGPLSLALRGVNDHAIVAKAPQKKPVDVEMEKRMKLEEEKRLKLEGDLQKLKEELARRDAAPPPVVEKPAAPPPPPPTRFVAIYPAGTTEGGARPQLIQIDRDPGDEIEAVAESVASPSAGAKPDQSIDKIVQAHHRSQRA